jgi:hypothetical protein
VDGADSDRLNHDLSAALLPVPPISNHPMMTSAMTIIMNAKNRPFMSTLRFLAEFAEHISAGLAGPWSGGGRASKETSGGKMASRRFPFIPLRVLGSSSDRAAT